MAGNIPSQDFLGTDSFTYDVSDDNGGMDTAIVTVAVTLSGGNDAPVGVDDTTSTDEDTDIVIDVLGNDTDADGDPLTVDSVTNPAFGPIINNGSDVTYTPDADFNGEDSFEYTVSDSYGDMDTATVMVTVQAVSDAPVATDDEVTTDENTEIVIDVLANDSDADGDTLTVDSVTDPASGSVVNNGSDVSYTPNSGYKR